MKTGITRTVTADSATVTVATITRKGAVVGSTTYGNRADTGADLLRWVEKVSAWRAADSAWPVEYIG
jgi:hypothetical protein